LNGETIIEPSRSTPVYGEFDVVVVGGGPAGIMAASAAARTGCSTLLIERYGFLGGAGTAGGLSTFCGLHARTHGQDVRVIRGLADELLDRLGKLDGLNAPHLTIADGIAAQAFDISAYKIAADELVTGSGARILFHAMAVGVVMKNGGGPGAHRASSSGPVSPQANTDMALGAPGLIRAGAGDGGGVRAGGSGAAREGGEMGGPGEAGGVDAGGSGAVCEAGEVGGPGEAGEIDAIIIESKSGRQAVRGRFFIDASGDGDLAAWAGVPWEKAPPIDGMMYPSLMFRINGVDVERAGPAPWRTVERLMDEAERAGTHTFPRKKPIVRPQRNPLEWRANLTQLRTADGGAIDGTDVDQLTLGELTGRQQALDAFTFIRDRTPGFEGSYIVDIAPQIGIRETRRIIGAYQLTEDDVLGCADFEDTIGVNGWPVEAHVAGTVEFRWQRDERGFNQLPFRIIVPPATANLYVAGRCASMTHGAQSAARVTGPCFVMGEAAGLAASMALSAGVAGGRIDVRELQRRLEDQGVYLGRTAPEQIG
jgi:FAD dependent oxidoreductase